MFAVMVKKSERKLICFGKAVWVKDILSLDYVSRSSRGLWATKEEAQKMIADSCEIVVEVEK